MELKTIKIHNPENFNMILGQSHFIKTIEDIHEAIVCSTPSPEFGAAFCEASEVCLVRHSGTDPDLVELACKNAFELSAGHCFIIFMKNMFPLNILNSIKNIPEVCRVFCATANPVEVIIAETSLGRGIMGVIDGYSSKGIEKEDDIQARKDFLRAIGYKK